MNYTSQSSYNDKYKLAWDARENFLKEILFRVHDILNVSKDDHKRWFDYLSEFFDFAACVLSEKEEEDMLKELTRIHTLIFAKEVRHVQTGKVKVFSDSERHSRKSEASIKMRTLFRKINKKLFKLGLYIPIKEIKDPGKAILEGFD